MRFQHLFNNEKKKGPGPMLIIEACSIPGKGGVFMAHKWHGTGYATVKEITQLMRHMKRREELGVFLEYVDRVFS